MDRARFALAVPAAAFALLQLDGTIASVAAPAASGAVAHGPGLFVAAFFATYAIALLPAGAWVDAVGGRSALLAGLGVFAAGALLTAIDPTLGLAGRLVQGVGAGLVSPAALAAVAASAPPGARGRAFARWGAITGLAALAGPLVGGLLTALAGWRANWYALAVAAAALDLVLALLPAPPGRALGAEDRGATAVRAAALSGIAFAALVGGSLLLEERLQGAAGWSPLAAGLGLGLAALPFAGAARSAGVLADRHGETGVAAAGSLLAAAGMLLAALGPPATAAAAIALVASGLGMVVPAASRAAFAGREARLGVPASRLSLARLVGAAAGAASVDLLSGVAFGAAAFGLAVALLAAGLPLALSLRPVALPARP